VYYIQPGIGLFVCSSILFTSGSAFASSCVEVLISIFVISFFVVKYHTQIKSQYLEIPGPEVPPKVFAITNG
jgi:hypothetical protein